MSDDVKYLKAFYGHDTQHEYTNLQYVIQNTQYANNLLRYNTS